MDPKLPLSTTVIRNALMPEEIDHVWNLRGEMVGDGVDGTGTAYRISRNLQSAMSDGVFGKTIKSLLLPEETVANIAFWESSKPFILHTDGPSGKPTRGRIITLPMPCDPHGIGCPTVIFKAIWSGPPAKFIKGLPDNQHSRNSQIEVDDYSEITGWMDRPFDREMHATYLAHLTMENLHGFEIESVVPWIPGNVLMFDNRMIHASSDYISFGIDIKRGISIATRIS